MFCASNVLVAEIGRELTVAGVWNAHPVIFKTEGDRKARLNAIFEHTGADPATTCLYLIDDCLRIRANGEHHAGLLFDDDMCALCRPVLGLYYDLPAACALYGCGLSTGIVLDIGTNSVQASAVLRGYILEQARWEWAGAGVPFNTLLDPGLQQCDHVEGGPGTFKGLGAEVVDLLLQSLRCHDSQSKLEMARSGCKVVVCGGRACAIPNLLPRLREALAAIVPEKLGDLAALLEADVLELKRDWKPLHIVRPKDPAAAAWRGGVAVTKLSAWNALGTGCVVTKGEYDEAGPQVMAPAGGCRGGSYQKLVPEVGDDSVLQNPKEGWKRSNGW